MESGIYIVTLNNEHPISVNANDPRIAEKAIKVTKANCKVGKAKSLTAREKNYFKTFGEENVNFTPLAIIEDIALVERQILVVLDKFRIRGRTGRKNEWLSGIEASEAKQVVLKVVENSGVPYELV